MAIPHHAQADLNNSGTQVAPSDIAARIASHPVFLPSEWHQQSGVQLTWPHSSTDWCYILPEVTDCYIHMACEIALREPLLIVTPEPDRVRQLLEPHMPSHIMSRVHMVACDTDDTWARDHGFITLLGNDGPILLDFRFNGWGMKFAAHHDDCINRKVFEQGILRGVYTNCLDFVLEGGSIESDGAGTLLTTSQCLLSAGRNEYLSKEQIEARLKAQLHAERVLWLDYGYLAGDDTDSHIDTLARLCPDNTITYVKCTDTADEHYEALFMMEQQLQTFRTAEGKPYRLIPLPMPQAEYDEDGQRLPATYANFLVINGAVIVPTYNNRYKDAEAMEAIRSAYPGREIIGIDARVLIRQHGSIHCCTMQFPAGVLNII